MDDNTVSGRSGAFQNRSDRRFRPFQNRSGERSAGRFRPFQNRSWNEKAARNGQNNRYGYLKTAAHISLLAFCFILTLTESPWRVQTVCYLIYAAVFLLTDPLDMLGRFLAPQSRRLLALMAVLAILALIHPDRPFLTVAGFIGSAAATATAYFNQSWLASYNWLMSKAVQEALLFDVENKATKAWQAHGRRETRTLLHELGFNATDDILDILHRPVYITGYLNGYKRTAKYKSRLETAQRAAEQGKEYRSQLEELRKEYTVLEKDMEEVRQLLKEETARSDHLQQLYQKEHKENEQLRAINDELVADLPDPEIKVDHVMQIRQQESDQLRDTILAALKKGMSYAEAGKLAGVSKTTAYRIKKEADQEACQTDHNNIITIRKVAGGE